MRKPKPFFWVWLHLTGLLFFFLEWGIGAVVMYYLSKWVGLSVTTQRILATLWFLWASFKAGSRHKRRKEAALRRFSAEHDNHGDTELTSYDRLIKQSIPELMKSTGRTRKEVEEDLKYFDFDSK